MSKADIFFESVKCLIEDRVGQNIASQYNPDLPKFVAHDAIGSTLDVESLAEDFLQHDTLTVFHVFSQIISFGSSMIPGTTDFNGFKLGETTGYCDYMALLFGIKLFANPRAGTNPCGSNTSYTFTVGNVVLPKVKIYIEPLVKVYTPGEPLSNFADGNVVGFRIWYYILDPGFHPIDQVDALINHYCYTAGDCTDVKFYSPDEPPFSDELNGYEPGSAEYASTMKHLEIANKKLADNERNKVMARENYNREFEINSTRPEFMLGTITTPAIYYQIIQQHLMRCFKCPEALTGVCDECRSLGQNIVRYKRPDIGGEENLAEVIKGIRFAPLPPASMTEAVMCGMEWNYNDGDNDHWLIHMCKNPDYGYAGTITKRHAELLKRMGVCAQQARASNYKSISRNTGRTRHSFFAKELLFDIKPNIIFNIDTFFKDSKFPWVFSASELMLEVAEKQVREKAEKRQRSHIKKHCTGIENTTCFDTAVQRSDAYEHYFHDADVMRSLSSGKLTETTFSSARYVIQDPDIVTKSITRVLELRDATDEYFDMLKQNLIRFDKIRPLLPVQIANAIQDAIYEEGSIAFGTIFHSANPNITQLQRNAAKLIEESEGFTEIQTLDIDIGFDGSHIASLLMYFGYMGRDIIDNHITAFMILLATYRASHPHELESMIKAVDIVPNVINQGTAGTGKSNIVRVISNIVVKGTVSQVSSNSLRANSIACNYLGMLITEDELNERNDPFMASLQGKSVSEFKESATQHYTIHKVLQLKDDGTRIQDSIVTRWHCVRLINANTYRRVPGDGSHADRFDLFFALANQPVVDHGINNVLLDAQVQESGSNSLFPLAACSINRITPTSIANRTSWLELAHALHIQAGLAMRVGALPYVNMSLLGTLYNMIEKHMLVKFPNFTDSSRRLSRIYAYTICLTVSRAIHLVWTSEISPLLKYESTETESTVTMRKMNKSSILMIAPYLQATESICIFTITNAILQQILPSKIWLMIYRIAQAFCGYGTSTPNYAQYNENGQDPTPNINYLQAVVPFDRIESWAAQEGCNSYTLAEMLTYMENIDINVENVYMGGSRVLHNKKMKVIEVIGRDTLTEKIANAGHNGMTPITIPKNARIKILAEYLNKWSPDMLLKYIMEGMEHRHTRPRKVIVGDTIPGSPHLFATYNLKVNPKRIIKINRDKVKTPFMSQHIAPDNSISHESYRLNQTAHESADTIVFNDDVEKIVFLPWLRENMRFLPESRRNENGLLHYLPAYYDHEIQQLRTTSPAYMRTNHSPSNYPRNCIPNTEYHALLHPNHPYFSHYLDKSTHSIATTSSSTAPATSYAQSLDPSSDITLGLPTNIIKSLHEGQSVMVSGNTFGFSKTTPNRFNRVTSFASPPPLSSPSTH